MRSITFVTVALVIFGYIPDSTGFELTDTYDTLGPGGPLLSQGGIGYNNFGFGRSGDDFPRIGLAPISGTMVAYADATSSSLFTTGRCFNLKSFYWACRATVSRSEGNILEPSPCILTLTAFGARNQEVAKQNYTYTARQTSLPGSSPMGTMDSAVANLKPAKMIRISVVAVKGFPEDIKLYFDNVTYSQYDGSAAGLGNCPGFSDDLLGIL
ncbi:hypothetical protein EKO04_006299 [Ascochyta lentis]|uniref:Uncharacterized protein n=1 Tax=Ascochyta lentis TaxID=205686 RepID=A0A8H7J001_9PLEO|nr:hypothetical protein EKO04_006299 [Ascochyta lentis]